AKTAPRELTALRALARMSDVHVLGSIARHAQHEAVRRTAFEALQDHHEILSVALNSEFKDPTLAAVERITDRGELEQIAARAKNKSASKRARAIVREMDDRAAQEAADLTAEAGAAAADADLAAARRRIGVARREWKDLGAGIAIDADLQARFTAANDTFAARDTAAHDEDQRARRESLTRMQQFLARVEALAVRPELTLKAGERALRDVRAALGSVPPLPSKRDFEDIVRRLKAAQSALTPKVQELRDVADWQRWANVGIQEQLCEKMEALKALEDPEDIARHVRDLQQQWRQAADVPRAQGEALWH